MDTNDRTLLDETARLMIGEAQAAGNDRIFSATGFADENISIIHQQMRCVNLAWALGHTGRVKRGDVVAIIGGSFSGLMLAATLAIADDAIIYLFEKEKRLLHRFRDKSHRYLSPNLNSRYLGKNFHPTWSEAFFVPPVFKWSEDIASSVAASWLEEFKSYQDKLPIFTFLGYEVSKGHIKRREGGLTIDFRGLGAPYLHAIDVDLLIDATGFGEEANCHRLVDFSYWESGHRLIYDHLPKTCNVLVSGCGDSGLIEAMHYAISDFRHDLVESLWPIQTNLEAYLDIGLEEAKLDNIYKSEDVESYDGRVISEVCWWLGTWFRLEHWKSHGWSLHRDGEHTSQIFHAIEEVLRPHLEASFPQRNLRRLDWDDREAFAIRLSLKAQLKVRKAVRPIADFWISHALARLMRKVAVAKLIRVRKLHSMARPGATVTLNGTMPTPYTRQLSTYNVWLMRLLTSFPNVRYRQGKIANVEPYGPGQFCVTFKDGSKQVFDRVVTRYGPAAAKTSRQLSKGRSRDPHAGNWLLSPVQYRVPTDKPDTWKSINPAIHRVASKLDELQRRPASDLPELLSKYLYVQYLLAGPHTMKEGIYRDPQAWLSAKIRAGIWPSYVE